MSGVSLSTGYPSQENLLISRLLSLTFGAMREMRDAGTLSPAQMRVFEKPRPEEELYDVAADPNELNNLAGDPQHKTKLEEMRALMENWQAETGDALPSKRTPDEFDRETGEPLPNRVRPRASKKEMNL